MKKDYKEKKRAPGDIKEAALRLLSFRAHSEGELRRKLLKRGFSVSETAGTIEGLKKSLYLDDRVFSKTLAESRSRNKNWGRVKIAAELRNKGVEAGVVKEAVNGLGPEEEKAAAKNAFEKWRASKRVKRPLEKDNLVRAIRHLRARGFSVFDALAAAGGTNKEDFDGLSDESE